MMFINDRDEGLTGSILKFADYEKLHGSVASWEDHNALRRDLNKFLEWSKSTILNYKFTNARWCSFRGAIRSGIYMACLRGKLKMVIVEKVLIRRIRNLEAFEHCYMQACRQANRMLVLRDRTIASIYVLTRTYSSDCIPP